MSGIPLRVRLSLGSAARLSLAIVAFGTIAYRANRRGALDAADSRARAAVYSLAPRSSVGLRGILEPLSEAATNDDIVEALRTGNPNAGARRALAQLPKDSTLTVALGLRSPTGKVVLSLGRDLPAAAFDETLSLSSAGFGRVFARGDTILYEAVAPVFDGRRLVGSVVRVRMLGATLAARQAVTELMAGGELLFGNADGTLWTDLAKPMEGPPSAAATRYQRHGTWYIFATRPIARTPFMLAAVFPEDLVLAPVNALAWEFALIGAVIIGIGLVVGWWANSRITKPITELTDEAEAIAFAGKSGSALATTGGDELRRLQAAFRAMTERVERSRAELEEQVADRTRALEEAHSALIRKERLAVLGQMAGTVGHEIRNPLGVMRNVVFYLEAVIQNPPPKVREHLATLDQQISLTEKIVADILDFTRTKPPEVENVPIAPFLSQQIQRIVPPPGIEIRQEVEANLPPIHADPVQLGQVVLNLLTNAVQAMDGKGGTITLRGISRGERIRVEVEDQGPGVPDEDAQRIFEPLFTTKSHGFGLGLALSRSLAQANGGSLDVINAPAGGAIFFMDLPAAVVA